MSKLDIKREYKRSIQRLREIKHAAVGKQPIDIVEAWDYTLPRQIGTPVGNENLSPTTINWVMPPIPPSSGGFLNILRFIYMLEGMGFESRIVITSKGWRGTSSEMERNIHKWYFPLKAKVYMGMENAPAAFFSVATAWGTAYKVANFAATKIRCYFIQDFEPWFSPKGSEYVFAENTYRLGLIGITAGDWLREKVTSEYGMQAYAVGFSYERETYFPVERKADEPRRKVFFFARPETERRGFEYGMLTLSVLVQRRPDIEVILAGSNLEGYVIPFKHRNVGVVDPKDLGKLYRECDVALVFSLTNLSLLPLELMACGIPVVSNRAPWTEWLLSDDVCRLVPMETESIGSAIEQLLDDDDCWEAMRKAGIAKANATSWKSEAHKLADIFTKLAQKNRALT